MNQFAGIVSDPQYYTGERLVMTAHDSYRWLRYASDHKNGSYTDGTDTLAGLHENIKKPPKLPLISLFISEISSITGFTPERSAGYLSVFLPGLFVFPLGILLFLAGFPAAGIGAGLVGGLSFAYLSRTSAFQADTDMLNLFFISLGALSAYLASKRNSVVYSAITGLTMYVFWRWYFHGGFTLVYFLILLFALYGKERRVIILSALIYVLCASPSVFLSGFAGIYEFFRPETVRPVYAEVTELQTSGFIGAFMHISPYWLLAALGLLLSFFMGRRCVYLAVFYLLGFFAFTRGVRFEMFLAPLCGAGIGIVFDLVSKGRSNFTAFALVSSMCLFFILKPFLMEIPPPAAEAEAVEAIQMINETEPESVVAGLWDHGFLVQYLTGRTVFADGASQFKQGAEIFARTLLLSDSRKAAETLNDASDGRPVYVLFTPDMDKKFSAIIKTAGYKAETLRTDGDTSVVLRPLSPEMTSGSLELTEIMYFRLYVIGETDIPCFEKIYSNKLYASVYKVDSECKLPSGL